MSLNRISFKITIDVGLGSKKSAPFSKKVSITDYSSSAL